MVKPHYFRLLATVALFASPVFVTDAHAYSSFSNAREVASRDLSPFSKWTSVVRRYTKEASSPCGEGCSTADWQAMLESSKSESVLEKLDSVNSFFNKVKYVEDKDNWSKSDYWATPFEMLDRKAGDCEDYAIAKYFSLKKLGVSESAMRIMIVEDTNLDVMHAILEVRAEGKRFLLDNQVSRVVEESSVQHYRPIYAINGQQWWAYK